MRFRLLLPTALLLALVLAACGDDSLPPPLEVYEDGRARVLSRTDSGRALLIEHEPFDSVMTEPMVMELLLADPDEGKDLQAGDKIQFDLTLGQTYSIKNIETLPPSTRLQLAAPDSTAADTTTAGPPAPSDTTSRP